MSADLMLVCNERGEDFKGDYEKCVFVDETSMGCPHTEFGKMVSAHSFEVIDDKFIDSAQRWFTSLEHKDSVILEKIVLWLKEHIGTCLAMECW